VDLRKLEIKVLKSLKAFKHYSISFDHLQGSLGYFDSADLLYALSELEKDKLIKVGTESQTWFCVNPNDGEKIYKKFYYIQPKGEIKIKDSQKEKRIGALKVIGVLAAVVSAVAVVHQAFG